MKKDKDAKTWDCKKKEFQCVEQTKDSILFEIESNEEMEKQYPYQFKLGIRYTLDEKRSPQNIS